MMSILITDLFSAEAALTQALRLSRRGLPQLAFARALAVHDWAIARPAPNEELERLQARSATLLSWCCFMMANYEAGITFARTAGALSRKFGDLPQQARASSNMGLLLASIGEADAASEARAALDLAERAGDPGEAIWALNVNGVVLWLLKQPDRALPFSREAVELSRKRGRAETIALINLAGVEVELGLLADEQGRDRPLLEAAVARGIDMTREALGQARADGDGWLERLAVCNIAEYALHLGAFSEAEQALQDYSPAAGEPTDRCRAHYLHMLGRTLLGRDQIEDAVLTLLASRDIAMRSGDVESATTCNRDLSEGYARLGRFEQALRAHQAFHDLYVRQASEAAQRRARIYALQWETDQLRALASQARLRAEELAVSNQKLAQETERLMRASLEDPLTGLQNRRRLDLAFVELAETGAGFALAMIDVDHFKQVNDHFSHPVGDAVLRVIAGLLTETARSSDLIVRFGGEEFAVLMDDADPLKAASACERLRLSVAAHGWDALQPGLSVTVSIGVACSPEAPSHESLLALADFRLYAAKQAGRDRVVSGIETAAAPLTAYAVEQSGRHGAAHPEKAS